MPTLAGLFTHAGRRPLVVRDGEISSLELEAQVRSGDYFVTVATVLDMLGRKTDDYETKIALENIVSDLIYLQDNYTIIKNEQTE